jgi:FkbM family methyltransferase
MTSIDLPTGGVQDAIPKIIHQTWKTSEVPEKLKPLQATFLENHPSHKWKYVLWTDQDNEELIRNHYPWFLDHYLAYPHHIQRVDAARYFIMYHCGGVYADLDMQSLISLDPIVEQIPGVILGQEGQQHKDGSQRIGNAILFSSRHHPFWLRVFQELMAQHARSNPTKIGSVFVTTGPAFLHEVYLKNTDLGITVMPVNAFYPLPWQEPQSDIKMVERRQYPKSWTAHHWQGVWRSAPRQFRVVFQDQFRHLDMNFIIPRKTSEGYGPVEKSIARGLIHRDPVVQKWSELFAIPGFFQAGDNVIQVGAYNGYLTVPLAKMATGGQVHAFEPDNRSRALLTDTLASNQVTNVAIYNLMPSSHSIQMFRTNKKYNPLKPHRIVWRAQQPNGIAVCMGVPLNDLQVTSVVLLHIDAQGEEYSVLQGAERLLERDRPVITMEIWNDDQRHTYETPIRQDQVLSYLKRLRYSCDIIPGCNSTYLCTPDEMESHD